MNKLHVSGIGAIVIYCFLLNVICTLFFVNNSSIAASKPVASLYPGYPVDFHATGKIDDIMEDGIVVGDTFYSMNSTTTYHGPNGMVHQGSIKQGDRIGLMLTDKWQVVSLWLLDEATENKQIPQQQDRKDKAATKTDKQSLYNRTVET